MTSGIDTSLVSTALMIAALAAVNVSSQSPPARQLTVCHAGSLLTAFVQVEKAFTAQHPDVAVNDVSGGSVSLARQLATGSQPCDVYASADYLNVDLLLKPAKLADYTIVFASGRMVLAYLATDPKARALPVAGDFNPPASIPAVAANWYQHLLAPGVRIAGAHPFLDPGGYRAHLIFELAQTYYKAPDLYNALLEHYTVMPADSTNPAAAPALGRDYNFQITYEHGAATVAKNNPSYRYARMPDRIDLSNAEYNSDYARASVTTRTSRAPAVTSTSEHALDVAPVVITSSTSTTTASVMNRARVLVDSSGDRRNAPRTLRRRA